MSDKLEFYYLLITVDYTTPATGTVDSNKFLLVYYFTESVLLDDESLSNKLLI